MLSGIAKMDVFLNIPGVNLIHEIDQALNELYNTMISSPYRDDGRNLRSTFAKRFELKGNEVEGTFSPLLSFWAVLAASRDPDRYILPRFEQLKQSVYSPEALFYILDQLCNGSWRQLPVVWQRIVDVLIAHAREGSRAALAMHPSEYAPYTNDKLSSRHHVASFLSNDMGGEEYIDMMRAIVLAVGMLSSRLYKRNDDMGRKWILLLLEVCKAWDIHLGHAIKCRPSILSPLQIQVPRDYAISRQLAFLQSHELQEPRRAVRLLCLDPRQLMKRSRKAEEASVMDRLEETDVSVRVTACFNISEQRLEAMGGSVVDEVSQRGQLPESMGQERCLQLILADIWEDPDGQLDAWQRLYVRACVRKRFKYLWV